MNLESVRRAVLTCAVLGCGLYAGLRGQAPTPARDISGIYVRIDDMGGGSWDGLNAAHPRPELLDPTAAAGRGASGARGAGPGGRGAPPAAAGPRAVGVPIQVGATVHVRCAATAAFPAMLTRSVGFTIAQGKTQTLFLAEQPNARVVFTDGRALPKAGDPAGAMGYSVGRWEGEDFVIESVGVGGVPAGGWAGPGTRLIERYRLVDNGTVLRGTYTWDDPTIYAKPFTYQYQFSRSGPQEYSREEWCDSSNPEQGQSITPPVQLR